MVDLVIRGGTVVSATGRQQADIAIDGGRFVEIGTALPAAQYEIEAADMLVFPGLIDVHLHFNEPGRENWEGIATGSRSLAAGGGTLFFDMPLNSSPCTLDGASFDLKREAMERSSVTDFALWGGLTPSNLATMSELAERGVIGFKAFMCNSGLPEFEHSDDATLRKGMEIAARHNLPVAVHAESEQITSAATERIRNAGGRTVRDYLASRSIEAELDAIRRAAEIAKSTGARLHIVHVSSGKGVALAAELRAQGVNLTIETCPHYLFFTAEDMERLGAVAKCAPPFRDAAEREALWTAVADGTLDIVASDHSPSSPDLKESLDFFQVWGGIAGVQSTLNVLLEAGSEQRQLTYERIAQLTASTPARRFNIPNKGSIEIGFDADCVLVDPIASFPLESDRLFYRHKQSPYIGTEFRGTIRRTIRRGLTIYLDDQIVAPQPGQFIQPHA